MTDNMCPTLDHLTTQLHRLPGIGKKTAQRLALFLLRSNEEQVRELADAVIRIKKEVFFCHLCFNITEDDLCSICLNPQRDKSTICLAI